MPPAWGTLHHWAFGSVTPGTVMGPYYPLANKPVDCGDDLTLVARGAPRASGRPLHVTGRVLDLGARPVGGVIVEIWQANHVGRYDHPSDGNPAPIDPYFRGYGVTVTDAQGRYSFRTIQPAGYPVAPGWSRAPHVHFLLTGRHDRHVTQMWFPDEPLNAQDRLLLLLAPTERERVIARMKEPTRDMSADARCAVFDIVLPNG